MADGPWTAYQTPEAAPTKAAGPWDAYAAPAASASADPAAPAQPQMSKAERFGTGLLDPVYGAAQTAAHVLPIPLPTHGLSDFKPASEIADEAAARREATIKAQSPGGFDPYRVAGNVVNPLNYLPIGAEAQAAKAGPLAAAALSGAKTAAVAPVSGAAGGDFWAKKGEQVAEGAAVGAGTTALGKAGKALIAPQVSAAQRALMAKGVDLTPGQMFGSTVGRAEEVLKKFPILGDFIRKGQGRSIEDFNEATINQALEPVGDKLPQGVKAGREAIDYAQRALGDRYDALLPTLRFRVDPAMEAEVKNLGQLVTELPPAQREQWANFYTNRVKARLGPQQNMDGETLKQVDSELANEAKSYSASGDAAQRQYGVAITEMRNILRNALERQNPQAATDLSNINAGYAMLVRAENASTRRAGSGGIFTPMDLLSAVRSGDKSARNRAFARGDALMQDWAEAAQKVLPNKVPDSGTAERSGYFDFLKVAGGAAAGTTHPTAALTGAAAGGAAILPYTKTGMAALRKYVEANPQQRAAVGQALMDAAEAGAPLSAILARFGVADPGEGK